MAIDTLRSVAHLQREIGDELFAALVSSDNTEAVREFAEMLANSLPAKMTVGGRTYEILNFLKAGEEFVTGDTMVARAKEMNANLGKDDTDHILAHQDEIPESLRGKITFVFTDWRHPDGSRHVAYLDWDGGRWVQGWGGLGRGYWDGGDRVLRRK